MRARASRVVTAVEGPADVGCDEFEADGAEKVPEGLRRACGPLFEDLLDVVQHAPLVAARQP